MGPRLGRVEYLSCPQEDESLRGNRFNGATLRTRGIRTVAAGCNWPYEMRFNGATLRTRGIPSRTLDGRLKQDLASMGPRLGRVEYEPSDGRSWTRDALQWGHA